MEPKAGGRFSIYGGSVEATFTALEEPSQINMDWRFRNWPDGSVSKVCGADMKSPIWRALSSDPKRVTQKLLDRPGHARFHERVQGTIFQD